MRKRQAVAYALAATLHASPGNAGGIDLDRIAGLYVDGFLNGDVEGGRFWSDNVLEIVKIAPDAAYFRTFLMFFNGHQCSFWGVAEMAGQSLVYRDPGQQCELRLDVAGGTITFDDRDYHCREMTCGARGHYNGVSFKLTTRRPIHYMQKLLTSNQYQEAVTAYKARHQE